jgi:hypothetical protein
LGARGGYELPNRISVFGLVGYLRFQKEIERRHTGTTGTGPAEFELSDRLRFSGPFAGAGLGYRAPIAPLEVRLGFAAGAIFASARDRVDGRATAEGTTASVSVIGSGKDVRGADVFLLPDASVAVRISKFRASLGVMVPVFLLSGPNNDHEETVIDDPSQCPSGGSVFCAPFQTFTERERAWGRFLAVLPYAAAGYVF